MAESPAAEKERLEFLWKVHSYTNDYIRFADQKAGLVLAIESGLVAAMYSAKLHLVCSPARLNFQQAEWAATLLGGVSLCGFVGLLLGISFALHAISPRLWKTFRPTVRERLRGRLIGDSGKGSVFWRDVLAHGSPAGYTEHVTTLSDGQRAEAVAHHVHALAGIADEKFGWVTVSLATGTLGAVCAVVALFVS